MTKPILLIATPEIILGLPEGTGNLMRHGLNMSGGGMAPVNSSYFRAFRLLDDFDTHLAIPKWEESLRKLSGLTTEDIKRIESETPGQIHWIVDAAFTKTVVEGSNTRMYTDTTRFTVVDRAIAFSRGIANYLLHNLRPDILWVPDWWGGPAAVVAKGLNIPVVLTAHNLITNADTRHHIIKSGIEIRNRDTYQPEKYIRAQETLHFDFMTSALEAADDITFVSPAFLERLLLGAFDSNPMMSLAVIEAVKERAREHHKDGRPRVRGYLNPLENDKSEFLDDIARKGLTAVIKERKKNDVKVRRMLGLKPGGYLAVYPNRLYEQKNPRLMIHAGLPLARKHDLRIVFLSMGDEVLEREVGRLAIGSGGLIAFRKFERPLEELIKRCHSSVAVMTPHYEPCGGPNINYPAEGTLVVGHAVDGIRDTVTPLDVENDKGTGFPFDDNDYGGLDYGFSKFVSFMQLPDDVIYRQLMRIAKHHLDNHSGSARARLLTNEVFWPLWEETRFGSKKTNL